MGIIGNEARRLERLVMRHSNQEENNMAKFRKKPVEIEAIQWDGTLSGIESIKSVFADIDTVALSRKHEHVSCWEIGTLEGKHRVSVGDYVIKGVKGEYYPCKPDIFAATYDAV